METKVDLHVHSKYSDRPSEWFLRRIGAPESFVEPGELYRTCRERGMDYVTITDHNSISGALEIAHLPGTFLSSEITTYFPENRCKIHCLVYGLTEKWFADIQEARENIYDLREYLLEHNIIHSIAHPLFRVNDRLTVEQFEKLLVMFNRFEGLNGSRCSRAGDMANLIFQSLTPELIAELADKHGIEPAGKEPWVKRLTGGSDDHSGLYSAGAHTVTPESTTVFDFLGHLREGRHEPGGHAGSSLRLAHSLYHIAYSYYRDRFLDQPGDGGLIGGFFERIAGQQKPAVSSSLRSVVPKPIARLVFERKKKKLNDIERLLVDEFQTILERNMGMVESHQAREAVPAETTMNFQTACTIGHQLTFAFLQRFIEQIKQGGLIESLQSLSSLGPVLLGMAPYVTAFGAQHKDETFLQSVAARFPAAESLRDKSGKRAWFTDTFNDVNGVSHTIRQLAGLAHQRGMEMTVITSLEEVSETDFPLRNFKPVGTFSLPEYESQEVVFPPVLDILEYIEREQFDEIIVSTPGPMGLTAIAAAKLLQLRVKGIYHTDFPKYVGTLTDDDILGEATWRFMQWFYGGMEHIYVPSKPYRDQLVSKDFDPEKISILSRGVDLELFNPERRRPDYWKPYGLNGDPKLLYVGRVSREKNVKVMLDAFSRLREKGLKAQFAVVGDGPYLEELKSEYDRHDVIFTGYLRGEALAEAYASADVFVFPSTTDTFGNAVLEAHACGLPAIVSDRGGPPEIVRTHNSGLIVDTRDCDALADAMLRLLSEKDLQSSLREGALARANESQWEKALAQI